MAALTTLHHFEKKYCHCFTSSDTDGFFSYTVKVMVKFIRKGIYYNSIKVERNGGQKGEIFPPQAENGSKDSK
jgi:hypothetical protein